MPAKKGQSGIASIVILLVLLIAVIAGVFFFKDKILTKFSQKGPQLSNEEVEKETKDWQTYNFKFAQVALRYPQGWVVKSPDSFTADYKYVDFLPIKGNSEISINPFITVSAGLPYEDPYYNYEVKREAPVESTDAGSLPPPPALPADNIEDLTEDLSKVAYSTPEPRKNFNIPALGEGENAVFSQEQDQTIIRFKKNGVEYTFTANIYTVLQEKMDPVEVNSVLTKMAKSVTFTTEVSSCENFVLKPLADFPQDFVLSNAYASDKKDPISGYSLDINNSFDKVSLRQTAQSTSERVFVVSYKKEGQPFEASEPEMKKLVNLEGGGDLWANNLTVVSLVNCAKDLTNPQVMKDQRIYKIGETAKNPFYLELYASSDNPSKLWGAKSWNIDLLKQTRGAVYVKRGDKLQKYTATNYYVTLK